MSAFTTQLRAHFRYLNAFGGWDTEERLAQQAAETIDRQDVTVDFLVGVIAGISKKSKTEIYELLLETLQDQQTQNRK